MFVVNLKRKKSQESDSDSSDVDNNDDKNTKDGPQTPDIGEPSSSATQNLAPVNPST